MSRDFTASASEYRSAIRRHQWPDNAERIARAILDYSIERGRYKAMIPTQVLFKELCGMMSKGKVSQWIKWLKNNFVIQVEFVPVSHGGRRRRWAVYTLLPPGKWKVPLRVASTQRAQDVELWLANLDPDQPELIAPPQTLNDLLVEDFVERSGTSIGTGHGSPSQPQGSVGVSRVESESRETGGLTSAPERGLGGIESKSKSASHDPMVPPQGTIVETEAYETAAKVPSGGTLQVPPQENCPAKGSPVGNTTGGRGEFESKYSNRDVSTDNSNRVQQRVDVPPQGTSRAVRQGALEDFISDQYIREKLNRNPGLSRELVNGINRDGKFSLLSQWFGKLYKQQPDAARALLSESLLARNPNGWLNRAVRVALEMENMPTKVER